MPSDELKQRIKSLAAECGFARVAIAPAGPVAPEHAERFGRWLADGRHGGMAYLARNVEKRVNPAALVEGARSVICLAVGYAGGDGPAPGGTARRGAGDAGGPLAVVARYARGRDYHKVLKKRCLRLMDAIGRVESGFAGRAFVDSAPVMERTLATAAGLGWIGRNGCLIVPGLGSYVVLAEIICNLPLAADEPIEPRCGDCDACVRACPSGACLGYSTIDARLCVSYLTVEHAGDIAPHRRQALGCRLFGCDACQEACPHNRGLPPGEAELAGPGGLALAEVLGWTPADWDAATRGRALRRTGYAAAMRNALIAAGNSRQPALAPAVEALPQRLPELRALADWSLRQLRRGRH